MTENLDPTQGPPTDPQPTPADEGNGGRPVPKKQAPCQAKAEDRPGQEEGPRAQERRPPARRGRLRSRPRHGIRSAAPAGGHLVIVESPGKIKSLTRYLTADPRGPGHREGVVRTRPRPRHEGDRRRHREGVRADLRGAVRDARRSSPSSRPRPRRRRRSGSRPTSTVRARRSRGTSPRPSGLANGTVDERVRRVVVRGDHAGGDAGGVREPARRSTRTSSTRSRRAAILDRHRRLQAVAAAVEEGPRRTVRRTRAIRRLRLVVDREREILAFVPVEYWTIEVPLDTQTDPAERFASSLHRSAARRSTIAQRSRGDRSTSRRSATPGAYTVTEVRKREQKQNPPRPFITSTLQQEASRKLGFSARKTMVVAQQLYEGVELGAEGQVGLITYMRTDSVHLAPERRRRRSASSSRRGTATSTCPRSRASSSPRRAPRKRTRRSVRRTRRARPDDIARYLEADQLGSTASSGSARSRAR